MNVRKLREYIILCDFFEIEPTWKGLRSFQASFGKINSCEINVRKRETWGSRNGRC